MHKTAPVFGPFSPFVSITLTVVPTETTSSDANLQQLAAMALILLAIGAAVMGYSIWEDVF